MNKGKVVQVIGSTFDAEFDERQAPALHNALRIDAETKGVQVRLMGEVQQHIGGGRVRAVALGATEGLTRGMEVWDTGDPGDGARRAENIGEGLQSAGRAHRQSRTG